MLLRRATALNPCHPLWFHHGLFIVHFRRGEYHEAYEEAEKVGHEVAFWDPVLRATALGKLGRAGEAEASIRELRRIKPDFERRAREFLRRTATPPRSGTISWTGCEGRAADRPLDQLPLLSYHDGPDPTSTFSGTDSSIAPSISSVTISIAPWT